MMMVKLYLQKAFLLVQIVYACITIPINHYKSLQGLAEKK